MHLPASKVPQIYEKHSKSATLLYTSLAVHFDFVNTFIPESIWRRCARRLRSSFGIYFRRLPWPYLREVDIRFTTARRLRYTLADPQTISLLEFMCRSVVRKSDWESFLTGSLLPAWNNTCIILTPSKLKFTNAWRSQGEDIKCRERIYRSFDVWLVDRKLKDCVRGLYWKASLKLKRLILEVC